MRKLMFYIFLLIFFSCKKNETIYYPDGKPKYINEWKNHILNIKRYDSKGNLIFRGKFKDSRLIDTLYIYDDNDDNETFIKMNDSISNNFFYGTYITKYSTGKITKISPLRFKKGNDLDSILNSSRSYGKEILYNPDGILARETHYKIIGDSSILVSEKIYDEKLKK
ncbi:hypothetical protein HNP24_000548 [Chryseobacterium sediminis]|uniref:Uncharacterized protein n=1 Tax=Chryseobacterium sediminis TaxID=1679494 RepID=A0ABR6PXH9_9FLAO|nr:hypothetical protein [Chryseobacterium sediminis]MBB6329598.1 hypothetical protein [Chryseobacterium sediminis]